MTEHHPVRRLLTWTIPVIATLVAVPAFGAVTAGAGAGDDAGGSTTTSSSTTTTTTSSTTTSTTTPTTTTATTTATATTTPATLEPTTTIADTIPVPEPTPSVAEPAAPLAEVMIVAPIVAPVVAEPGPATTIPEPTVVEEAVSPLRVATDEVAVSALAVPATRPANPGGVRAIAGNATVVVNWNAPLKDGGSPIMGYRIQRSTNASSWSTIAWPTRAARSARISGLRNGTRYYFRVIAVNAVGASPASWWSAATPSESSPSVPQNPGGLRLAIGNEVANLSWSAPVRSGASAVTAYRVQRSTSSTSGWATFAWIPASTRSLRITGLHNGTRYYFRVIAVNAHGAGRPSWWATGVPSTSAPGLPGNPGGLRVTSRTRAVTVTWNAPLNNGGFAVTAYRVQRSSNPNTGWQTVAWLPASTRSATIGGLRDGTKYFFRAIAVNRNGAGRPSWWVAATPGGSIAPPPSGSCAAARHTPGGADHLGGCWPGPANTGVPAGTTLVTYAGPCNISANGTVIDARVVNCDLTVSGRGVVVRRSRINGTVQTTGSGSLTITDSEVVGGAPTASGYTMIGEHNVTIVRVEVIGGNRGIMCSTGCTVRDSWIHGQFTVGDLHVSGIRQSQGATLIHNSIACDAPTNNQDGGCSGNLVGYGDFEPVKDNLIQQNLFIAGPGAYCAYGGSSGDNGSKPFGDQASNIDFIDNVFQVGPNGKCASFAPVGDFNINRPGNSFVNNHWSNGLFLPTPAP